LLETKDEKEKASLNKLVAAVKYMYRMKPSIDFSSLNRIYLGLMYDYFQVN
jgi:hypothetical protein